MVFIINLGEFLSGMILSCINVKGKYVTLIGTLIISLGMIITSQCGQV